MKEYFKNKFALSDQGAKEMISGIISVVAQNLALMFPVTLLYIFTGDYIEGVDLQSRTWIYIGGIALCLALIVLTSIWQYNTAYKATYKESAARRISLAEKLRRLPLSQAATATRAVMPTTAISSETATASAARAVLPAARGLTSALSSAATRASTAGLTPPSTGQTAPTRAAWTAMWQTGRVPSSRRCAETGRTL